MIVCSTPAFLSDPDFGPRVDGIPISTYIL